MDSQQSKFLEGYVLVPKRSSPHTGKVDDGPREDEDMSVRRRGTLLMDDTEQKQVEPRPARLLTVHRALAGRGKASKPIQAWLSYYSRRDAGAANTAFAGRFTVQPNGDASWASWQQVFDEFKVLSAEIHWTVWFSTLPTGFATQTPNAIVAYEPGEYNALTSVNSGMEYEHFQLLNIGSNSNGTYATAPQSTAKGGHMVFRTKIPGGTQLSNVDTTLSTGMWRPTSDASDYYWGQFVFYVAQGGATSVLQIEAFTRMRVEFRCRR